MIPPPRHIQAALDREFPGVKLQWNPRLGFWVLTDNRYHTDGTVAYDIYWGVPNALQGVEPYPFMLRGLIFVMGDLQTGERYPIYCDRILETLRRAFRGVKDEQVHEHVDEIEALEEAAEQRALKAERERAHDSAERVWNGLKRSTFGAGSRRTPWTFAKALDKEYAARRKEQEGEAEAELDQIVAEEAAAGRTTLLHSATIGTGR